MPIVAWVAIIGIAITVLVQFAGIVWFAATQRTMLNALTISVRELTEAMHSIDALAGALNTRVSILEDRAGSRTRRRTDTLPN